MCIGGNHNLKVATYMQIIKQILGVYANTQLLLWYWYYYRHTNKSM